MTSRITSNSSKRSSKAISQMWRKGPVVTWEVPRSIVWHCSRSFDEYAVEIRSGRLSWTPVHQSEKFWVENAAKLNEANFELLRSDHKWRQTHIESNLLVNFRMLLRLLEQSKEPLVLCVAAHDIGEYVRHYPHGKRSVELFIQRSFI